MKSILLFAIGKEFPAKRVVMFSVIDFLDNGAIPSWVDNTTNHENYYALIHLKARQPTRLLLQKQ